MRAAEMTSSSQMQCPNHDRRTACAQVADTTRRYVLLFIASLAVLACATPSQAENEIGDILKDAIEIVGEGNEDTAVPFDEALCKQLLRSSDLEEIREFFRHGKTLLR